MSKVNVAVVWATGMVGESMLSILEQREFPIKQLYVLASKRSKGKTISFKDESLTVQDLAEFDFSQADIAFFSAGGDVSKEHAPRAAQSGCLVIDNTSTFRYDDSIPLIVPEVNPHAIRLAATHNIIANPNCSTIQMVVALNPIHQAVGITRINVATYQAVSGAGRTAVEEMKQQVVNDIAPEVFPVPIAYNVIPHIDVFLDNGYTKEEMKMVWETKKILEDSSVLVNPTAVRIPISVGHSEAIHLETKQKLTAEDARVLLQNSPGVIVKDERVAMGYPTPRMDASGQDAVFVGRIREDLSHPRGLNLWVFADNVRKGAALNSIQIAELWLKTQ